MENGMCSYEGEIPISRDHQKLAMVSQHHFGEGVLPHSTT